MRFTLLCGIAVLFFAGVWCHGDHGDHGDHDNSGDSQGEMCAAHTKSHDLMEQDAQYKMLHLREKKRAKKYVNAMKLLKDGQFHRDLTNINIKQDANGRILDNNGEKLKDNRRLLKFAKEEAKRRQLYSQYENNIDSESVIRIPIVFHVLYSNDDENLSNKQLESQVSVLNKDFRGNNDEINGGEVDSTWESRVGDTKIEFYKYAVNRVEITGKSSDFCSDESNIKLSSNGGSDQWDPETYLNFWTCDLSADGLLGYAYFPCLLGSSNEWKDGVVVTSGAVGSSNDDDGTFYFSSSVYDEGRTATHEIGHYLSLNHLWGYYHSCSTTDTDDIDDTPLQYGPNYGCPTTDVNSCNETDSESDTDLPDMTINFMDYVNDACMYVFTEEQAWNMRSVMKGCRITMYENGINSTTGSSTTNNNEENSTTTTEYDDNFHCDDGCEIPTEYIDDNFCDCSNCEDEQDWTCNSCSSLGCPDNCYSYTYCDGNGNNGSSSTTDDYYYDCNDGCSIDSDYYDDGWCDCSECEDEPSWTCDDCSGGCPDYCGGFEYCNTVQHNNSYTYTYTYTYTTDNDYIQCNDGCYIYSSYVNDGDCDCSECEDESCYTCDTCSSEYGSCDGINCTYYGEEYGYGFATNYIECNYNVSSSSDCSGTDLDNYNYTTNSGSSSSSSSSSSSTGSGAQTSTANNEKYVSVTLISSVFILAIGKLLY